MNGFPVVSRENSGVAIFVENPIDVSYIPPKCTTRIAL